MTELVVCLSSGKGTWEHVKRLINEESWEKTYIITNSFGKDNFKVEKPAEYIIIDENKYLSDLIQDVKLSLKGKIIGTEVALNMISGSGKEHMAILSALLQSGLAIRQVALTKDGVKEV